MTRAISPESPLTALIRAKGESVEKAVPDSEDPLVVAVTSVALAELVEELLLLCRDLAGCSAAQLVATITGNSVSHPEHGLLTWHDVTTPDADEVACFVLPGPRLIACFSALRTIRDFGQSHAGNSTLGCDKSIVGVEGAAVKAVPSGEIPVNRKILADDDGRSAVEELSGGLAK